jgi:hypothetical protein
MFESGAQHCKGSEIVIRQSQIESRAEVVIEGQSSLGKVCVFSVPNSGCSKVTAKVAKVVHDGNGGREKAAVFLNDRGIKGAAH